MPGVDRMRILVGVFCLVAASSPGAVSSVSANPEAASEGLKPGAIELSVAGMMTTTEGITNGSLVARAGYFVGFARQLFTVEAGFGYHHVSSLDQIDAEAALLWNARMGRGATYAFVGVAGGVRHEDIGSFSESRYPLGFGLGLRSLWGRRAAMRFEYQFRRIVDDPVSDFNESRWLLGLSVFFRNGAAPPAVPVD